MIRFSRSSTRRDFLATSSRLIAGSVAGSLVAPRLLTAQHLPRGMRCSSSVAPAEVLPTMEISALNLLATAAVDAARRAGATYADIRLGDRQYMAMICGENSVDPIMSMDASFTYGVRVLVDGVWSFVHGTVPSVDSVTTSARNAVATARGYGRIARKRIELAPAPAVTGEWTMPIQLDPFTVPMQDQAALLDAYRSAALRVPLGQPGWNWDLAFHWTRERRTFASTEGSLVTQHLWRSEPWLGASADAGMGRISLYLQQAHTSARGYEAVAIAGLQDEVKRLAEEAYALARLPVGQMEVGRYPMVMDGMSLGVAFNNTVNAALELDRVLGTEADASGSSYLAPLHAVWEKPIVSPLISATAHRSMPSVSAVKWDDEGVEAVPYPVITKGRLVDYHTSRETAMALQAPYAQRGQTVRSRGCAVSSTAQDPVLVRMPHITIEPAKEAASLTTLCQQVKRGVLLREAIAFMTDQQLSSGSMMYCNTLFEIKAGVPVRRLLGNGLTFRSRTLWKSLRALGDSSTVRSYGDNTFVGGTPKGMPWSLAPMGATAPAGLFGEVDVVTTPGAY